ncbi:phage late control D family protein [Rubrivivax gelatinosus]|uniref:Late control protein n=1 Tax=Rubrivivax gelatinosus TaxID=28068 RepID=A0ABS1DMV6_RUBGE|nr:phage late control D family protein [Rubrivivax gelatinosus]MBK1711291.1 late control protein [Rubrivivax gelatinosus]
MSGEQQAALRAPDYRISLGGRDITRAIEPRLGSLTLTECRGGQADQLDLELTDHDGQLEIPRRGVTLTLAIGWAGQPLVDKGTFIVDEAEHSGPPDKVVIRGRSAELSGTLRTRRDASWHGTTLGAIVATVAKRHSLEAKVADALASRAIAHVDQTQESDIAFINRLARRYDAVATVKAARLLFLPIVGARSAAGAPMQQLTIRRSDGDTHRWHAAERDAYTGVRAYWHDPKRAKRRGVTVGTDANAKRLADTFASEADALAGARAEWARIQRGAATLELTLAHGQPALAPQTPVKVAGFKAPIDAADWLAVKVTHSISDSSGFTTAVELETGIPEGTAGATVEDVG